MLKRLTYESGLVGGVLNSDYTVLTVSDSIMFTLPKAYPFHPPTMLIHSRDHVSYLVEKYCIVKPLIDKYKLSIECFCCSSLTCSWSPCNTCKDLYHEYIYYLSQLKTCAKLSCLSMLPFDDNVCNHIASYVIQSRITTSSTWRL